MDFKPLKMPRELVAEKDSQTETFGRFVAEPFERGFGLTIGNSMRRILLSSIQGAAVTAIRIEGKNHEFDTVEGVKEDITDIELNLKSLNIRFQDSTRGEATMFLEAVGPKVITAADFDLDGTIEILNPEQVIATLSDKAEFRMECVVQQGRGYVAAATIKDQFAGDTFGTIYIDAVFSPIRNVRYLVEAARVQQRTDYDRLIIEVTTNGTVRPEDAVSYAAKVLRDHLNLFISMKDQAAELAALEEEQQAASATSAMEEKLDKSIEELELSVRSFNCLEAAGIKTIRDLVQKTESEMLKYRNFGRKSLTEIKNILKEMNLRFGMEIDKETGLPLAAGSDK